jgi:hypothetical protein
MAGFVWFVPAIHAAPDAREDVDARDKRGQDARMTDLNLA